MIQTGIIILLLAGFAYLSHRKPALGLGLIVSLTPIYLWRFNLLFLPTTFLELMVLTWLVVTFRQVWQKENILRLKNLGPLNWAVAAFVLAGFVSTLISPELPRAAGLFKAFIIEPVLLFYFAVLLLKTPDDLKLIFRLLLAATTLVSVAGIIQYFTHLGLPLQFWGSGAEPKRITSIFEYPNALALYLGPLLVFFVALNFSGLFRRAYFLFFLLTTSAALILTYSRGAWLAVILGIIFIFFVNQKRINRRHLILFLIFLALLGLLGGSRLTLSDVSSLAHLDLFKAGMEQVTKEPILGNGLFGFRSALIEQRFRGEVLNYPHNIVLNFWLELGLLGLISFAAIMFFSLDRYKNSPSAYKLAAAGYLLVLVLHGLVDVPYFKNDLSILFWFMIALFYLEPRNSQ